LAGNAALNCSTIPAVASWTRRKNGAGSGNVRIQPAALNQSGSRTFEVIPRSVSFGICALARVISPICFRCSFRMLPPANPNLLKSGREAFICCSNRLDPVRSKSFAFAAVSACSWPIGEYFLGSNKPLSFLIAGPATPCSASFSCSSSASAARTSSSATDLASVAANLGSSEASATRRSKRCGSAVSQSKLGECSRMRRRTNASHTSSALSSSRW
jgi:hypothetical protein